MMQKQVFEATNPNLSRQPSQQVANTEFFLARPKDNTGNIDARQL